MKGRPEMNAPLQPAAIDALPHILRHRQTKIVATLGPASSSAEVIATLFERGVDVFRLNFSHGSHDDHRIRYDILRDLERRTGRPVAVMADLQGPKLRLATFAKGKIAVAPGQVLRLDLSLEPGDETRVGLPHPEIFAAMVPGAELLLDDGKVRLTVESCGLDHAVTRVVSGTALSDRKGVNVPGVALPISALTPKDRADLVFALDLGVDWIALSFVQRAEDVAEARELIQGRAALLAKIEKPQAIQHLDAIVELADGIMVARGDLGVEMPPEDVPVLQKTIVREALRAGKPVIVATQMLESMVTAPAPTRAEASDVATAIFDGADAVMLSAETAAGAYPVEAVTIMNRIAERVEKDPVYRQMIEAQRLPPRFHTPSDAITVAARQVAQSLDAAAIATYTTSGSTTLRAARERPAMPILCIARSIAISRRMMLAYGVHGVIAGVPDGFQAKIRAAVKIAVAEGLAVAGDQIVVTAGDGVTGSTNVLRVAAVDAEGMPAMPESAAE
jgi:pyruvate kinase